MLKRIAGFFRTNFFDERLPIEYRIYMIFFMEAYFISILSAATNTMLGKGVFGIILQWSHVAFCTAVLFFPLKLRMRISKGLLIFMTFVYIPYLFTQTAGYDGTALLFSLLGIFMLAIVFKGKQRIVVVGLDILIYVGVSTLQFLYPDMIIPHGSEQAKYMDLLVALVLSTSGLAIMTVYISNAFDTEQRRIKSLLEELEQNNRQLAEMTNRDPLTGVYNRRYLTQFLELELETCDRSGTSVCVLMLDLDNFKQINDTYGHGFGDDVLISFSRTIQDNLRKYDVLARYGGEEFIVVLHDIQISAAVAIAERARVAVSKIALRNGVQITVSIGLVQSRHGESIDSIIRRADACLYQAKEDGRNKVVAETDKRVRKILPEV